MKNFKKIAEKLIATNPANKAELDAFKRRVCGEFKIAYPSNIELLAALKKLHSGKTTGDSQWSCHCGLVGLLRTRPVRSLSGIVNVSVLTKPYPCPGNCIYCPNEPGFPKSYLSGEPAAERAKLLKFNPYVQTRKRLENLAGEGHSVDKVELRVIGATWSFYPKAYQTRFVAACFAACNDFGEPKDKILSLEEEQKINETAKCRIVGLSVETRPDYINEKEILQLRKLGATRVELGVQSVYDEVLELNRRGHKIDATINATRLLKDAGFKVSYQVMLNLRGSDPGKDAAMAKELFINPDFGPDLLKIYPCMVLKEAELYKFYKAGEYRPYSRMELVNTLKEIKEIVPAWVRIERIIRDIPYQRIETSEKDISNLRQSIGNEMEREGRHCQCIRCREVKGEYDKDEKIGIVRRNYEASRGKEIFLSFENERRTKLFSLLRLRIAGNEMQTRANNHSPLRDTLKGAALIREIHTYGLQAPIGEKAKMAQHRGLGKRLIQEAEKIAKNEFGIKKIAVISGVGAREYWKKSGYRLEESYMVKDL